MWSLDNRGSPHRGREFEDVIYKRLGELEVEDQIKGINFIKEKYEFTKTIVYGWSYGGYMSLKLGCSENIEYDGIIAGGCVCSWEDYDSHYTERYMGLPQENREVYQKSSVLGDLKFLNVILCL